MSLHQPEITESRPKPLQGLLGGIGIALSVHSLLVLNGSVLGVSAFVHCSLRGDKVAMASVLGLVLGGIAVGIIGDMDTPAPRTASLLLRMVFSGLLVGIGTKLANGCTSGHMICGLSRFSLRSLVATTTFFASAVATTYSAYGNDALGTSGSLDWTLGDNQGRQFLGAILSLATLWFAYTCSTLKNGTGNSSKFVSWKIHSCANLVPNTLQSILRYLASLLTSLAFTFSLRLGNMVDPHKVLAFLALPVSSAFDPTLAFVAGSALPLATLLYRYARVKQPKLGGKWNVPTSTKIDCRLILGSVIFGIGWGIAGVCPGPALVNFGRSLYAGIGFVEYVAWLLSMGFGGMLVK
ncbi:uncharacterized protein BJ212DRAFT_32153 [Suillus subaureus]|uniref:Sulphur transport domain-containing protein n=1 Tax=Suillus subaureus TaxID=48587 RepID=A0A9P7EQ37_9AGAM|nr:uncharacterized protein BJ212DRAFT_32153 [Suillus subaureus]KAG1827123.1 hypothetical protein BJ212DRAFT_32153 [Suillus subaureus]